MKGVFERNEEYRDNCQGGCKGGYHGHRWDAHHILPCTSFSEASAFVRQCLEATDYDINKTYSMCGLPRLTAFILYFQSDKSIPFVFDRERTVTMRRWGKVAQYLKDQGKPVVFPGELPVHNPVHWGHTDYNVQVAKSLKQNVFKQIMVRARQEKHFKPEEIRALLEKERQSFWNQLQEIPRKPGGGGLTGIENNLRHRYDSARDGWWKPMCMTETIS
ncbi:MAG: AHH domain-containing protein [Anaeromyxobacter sp.]